MKDFTFTKEKLEQILVDNNQSDDWFLSLDEILPQYEIDTILRVTGFLAQTCHESRNYTALHENLNYKAETLLRVFPKYFNQTTARQYAHKREMIANRVYGNRMGNGPESSGDGYKYRGRGILQITGKKNYTACSQFIFNDDTLVTNPDLIETDMTIAIKSACWFWSVNNINQYCDDQDLEGMTKAINGGLNGIDDRIDRYNSILELLQQ
jgi:putative chitinase